MYLISKISSFSPYKIVDNVMAHIAVDESNV